MKTLLAVIVLFVLTAVSEANTVILLPKNRPVVIIGPTKEEKVKIESKASDEKWERLGYSMISIGLAGLVLCIMCSAWAAGEEEN